EPFPPAQPSLASPRASPAPWLPLGGGRPPRPAAPSPLLHAAPNASPLKPPKSAVTGSERGLGPSAHHGDAPHPTPEAAQTRPSSADRLRRIGAVVEHLRPIRTWR